MPDERTVIYGYDGSFEALLCCVFESVYERERPVEIHLVSELQPSLYPTRIIAADSEHAARVYASLDAKIGAGTADLVKCVFLSCAPQKEVALLRFLRFGYQNGPHTLQMLSHPLLAPLLAAQRSLYSEVHLLLGLIRFSDYGGGLFAQITPKNYVLPFLAEHFCSRFANETFLILDAAHQSALVWQNRRAEIIRVDHLEPPPVSAQEKNYRALWQRFYQSVAIAARYNPRCRMAHIPKRYWENMLELQPELSGSRCSPALPARKPLLSSAGRAAPVSPPCPTHHREGEKI